ESSSDLPLERHGEGTPSAAVVAAAKSTSSSSELFLHSVSIFWVSRDPIGNVLLLKNNLSLV
ncbi:hypothetical protein HAX54_015025, partial [Datura stramonium]|nr:hypothetical protein [Datura stramonium]